MAKENKLSREERAEKRLDLAAFYNYKPNLGQFPMSFDDMEIIQGLCDALERTNGLPRLRQIVESWKTTAKCSEVSENLQQLLEELPGKLGQKEELDSGLFGELVDPLDKQAKKGVSFILIQDDAFNINFIRRLGKSVGYDTKLNLTSYLILVNKHLQQGEHLDSTFTYTFYSEAQRDEEWERIRKALEEFEHVTFIK